MELKAITQSGKKFDCKVENGKLYINNNSKWLKCHYTEAQKMPCIDITKHAKSFGLPKPKKNQNILIKLDSDPFDEIEKQKDEKRINDLHTKPICLSYYYGDWYRPSSLRFVENGIETSSIDSGNLPNDLFSSMDLNEIISPFGLEEKIVEKLGKLFDIHEFDTPKPMTGIKLNYIEINDNRGTGKYVSNIEFESFEIFEMYCLKAFAKDLSKKSDHQDWLETKRTEAKKAGKQIVIENYVDECDGSVSECSFDNITVYIDGDGKQTSRRVHCH